MKRLQETNPIWHAVIWIILYVAIVNIGDMLSEMIGIKNLATSALLILLSIVLIVYVKRNRWVEYYGLSPVNSAHLRGALFFIPLIVITLAQYLRGIKPEAGVQDIVIICVLMICVGFLEELLFRGFLFQGILKKGSLNRAVIISGVTFGIGHIVNLARGYSAADQSLQIVAAIFIGIALACLVAYTRSILPGVIFHILFNISGSVASDNSGMEMQLLVAIIVLMSLYSLYLKRNLRPAEKAVAL